MSGTIFEQPYFIAPHAVKRFQERIANIPAAQVIEAIQGMLQNPGKPVDVEFRMWVDQGGVPVMCPVFKGVFHGRAVYMPVMGMTIEDMHGKVEQRWPIVPTILGPESALHWKRARGKKLRKDELGSESGDGVGDGADSGVSGGSDDGELDGEASGGSDVGESNNEPDASTKSTMEGAEK